MDRFYRDYAGLRPDVPVQVVPCQGPGRNFGSGFAVELVRLADVLLKRASSNLVLCYVAELLACLLALAFIAVAYVVVSVAIVLAFAAVALVVCLAGIPVILAASWRR